MIMIDSCGTVHCILFLINEPEQEFYTFTLNNDKGKESHKSIPPWAGDNFLRVHATERIIIMKSNDTFCET